jgi:hypothetical protein
LTYLYVRRNDLGRKFRNVTRAETGVEELVGEEVLFDVVPVLVAMEQSAT